MIVSGDIVFFALSNLTCNMFGKRCKVYKCAFWMRKYSSISWKRTWVWSITRRIEALDLGPLTKEEKQDSETTTTSYRDANGRKRFKGNPNLKKSQHLCSDKTYNQFCMNMNCCNPTIGITFGFCC